MSIHDPRVAASPAGPELPLFGWRARHRRKKEEALLVREAEWATEQARLQTILGEARRLVEENWIRGAWFAVRDASGRTRLVRGGRAIMLSDNQIVGSCVVGSVIRAAGGTAAAHEQSVQRVLDAVWHALREPEDAPVQWCPPPMTRVQHLRDLTRWNDYEARSADEVSSLLLTAERVVLFSED
ncbi:hypothetical protein GCM10025867_05680 [Frondihabitans sucicola]|uniref:Uncharacterized protein n=1 Tax=Frondihabitans sucicola TaxID=1268041 RepID=A0ABM8GIW3_9MICO|nr:hypothetical protein [Frondihabitans sucicola]BDZ48327.1 hypothetical protein GCM10025867_05680 [Frondihabitans sucicola]